MNALKTLSSLRPRDLLNRNMPFECNVGIGELERLSGHLADNKSVLSISYAFSSTTCGVIYLDLSLDGDFLINCHSCLDTFDFQWSSQSRLLLEQPRDKRQAMAADESYERVSMSDEGEFCLSEVVTDEILLGIPTRHPDECPDSLVKKYIVNQQVRSSSYGGTKKS